MDRVNKLKVVEMTNVGATFTVARMGLRNKSAMTKIVLNHDFNKIFRINRIKKTYSVIAGLTRNLLKTKRFRIKCGMTGFVFNLANLINLAKISVLTIAFVGLSLGAKAQFSGGSGTSGSPYLITTAAQLDSVRYFLSAHFQLGNDIDLTLYLASGGAGYAQWGSSGWMPLGSSTTSFTGTFKGAGYKVTGLWINRSGTNYIGLFGYTSGDTIENLGVEIDNAANGVRGSQYVGGLAGASINASTIKNCYVTGNVSGSSNQVGGLVGHNGSSSLIANCYATGNVIESGNNVGGLVGVNNNATISNCHAIGDVAGNGDYVGGLVGNNTVHPPSQIVMLLET